MESYSAQTPFTIGIWDNWRGGVNMSPQELYACRVLHAVFNGDDFDGVPLPTREAELSYIARAKLDAALRVLLVFDPLGYMEWDGAGEDDYLAQALFVCACVSLSTSVKDMYAPMEEAMNIAADVQLYPRRQVRSEDADGPVTLYDGESDMDTVPEDLRPSVYAHDVVAAAHMLNELWRAAGIRRIDESGLVTIDEARAMYLTNCFSGGAGGGYDNLVQAAKSPEFTPEYAVILDASWDGSDCRKRFAEWAEPYEISAGIDDDVDADTEFVGEVSDDTLNELLQFLE